MNGNLITHFFASTDLVVLGTNPENADYTNPRGEFYGSAGFVYAEDVVGNRVRLWVKTDGGDAVALEAAERVAVALNARLAAGKLPVAFASWQEARPSYGSAAYVEYGQDDDVALERREAEEEAFR